MSQIEVRIVFDIIKIILVMLALSTIQNRRNKIGDYCIFTVIYLLSYFFWEEDSYKGYIAKNIYLIFILIFYLLRYREKVKSSMPIICILLSIYEISKVLIGVLGGLTALFIPIKFISKETKIALALIFFMSIFAWLLICMFKKKVINFNISFSKKCMACFIYFLIVCGKIPFLYTDIQDALAFKMVLISIICCTIIFLIISRIEKRNAEKERAIIEENNKILSTKLHKSQEILPAMVQAVSDMVENSGTEMEGQHAHELLAEMTDLYGQHLKENSKEDLQLKNFCSTGLKLLDQQLRGYQIEASDKNVNLDIFVQAPINDIIKKDDIDQLKLQRAVGDLIRNAFRVKERKDKKCRVKKQILLIIGCRYEDILEISVVDNGEHFPLHVIEAFGRRGVTTGGTGNGLADLVEFADETKASICVEEFAWETSSFTKKVSIIFDKWRMNYFNSPREASVKSAFWNKN